jgi:hypothetical protein
MWGRTTPPPAALQATDDLEDLVCPTCGSRRPATESFCPSCRMPLIHPPSTGEQVSERHERARKIKPQLAVGEPVRVAGARNQAEAELIAGMLLEEGVPSLIRRTAGFDVPDFLAAGPRDVLVPQAAESVAREILLQAGAEPPGSPPPRVAAGRLFAGLLIALGLGALLIWLLLALVHPSRSAAAGQPVQMRPPCALDVAHGAPPKGLRESCAGTMGMQSAGGLCGRKLALLAHQQVDHGAAQQRGIAHSGRKPGAAPLP